MIPGGTWRTHPAGLDHADLYADVDKVVEVDTTPLPYDKYDPGLRRRVTVDPPRRVERRQVRETVRLAQFRNAAMADLVAAFHNLQQPLAAASVQRLAELIGRAPKNLIGQRPIGAPATAIFDEEEHLVAVIPDRELAAFVLGVPDAAKAAFEAAKARVWVRVDGVLLDVADAEALADVRPLRLEGGEYVTAAGVPVAALVAKPRRGFDVVRNIRRDPTDLRRLNLHVVDARQPVPAKVLPETAAALAAQASAAGVSFEDWLTITLERALEVDSDDS